MHAWMHAFIIIFVLWAVHVQSLYICVNQKGCNTALTVIHESKSSATTNTYTCK